jgi:hypothetical protein
MKVGISEVEGLDGAVSAGIVRSMVIVLVQIWLRRSVRDRIRMHDRCLLNSLSTDLPQNVGIQSRKSSQCFASLGCLSRRTGPNVEVF